MIEDKIVKLGIAHAAFAMADGVVSATITLNDGTELTRDFPADTTSFSSSGTALADVVNGQLAPNQLAAWGLDGEEPATDMPPAADAAAKAARRKSATRTSTTRGTSTARKSAKRKARR